MTEEERANRPDELWPWKYLDTDEAKWAERQAEKASEPPPTSPWWVWWLVGAIIGILLALL